MYPRSRRKKRTESMEVTTGERESDEEDDDIIHQVSKVKQYSQQKDFTNSISPIAIASLSSLAVPTSDDDQHQLSDTADVEVAHLLQKCELPELIQFTWSEQIQYFVTERSHLLNQLEHIKTQFDKHYTSLKRRFDDSETENERLSAQNRAATKQLLLYKDLIEAPENSDSSSPKKDYQQLKLTIDSILKENERLYAELHDFKTSDPVYDQVKLLETANNHLKHELIQITNQNNQLKKFANIDEIKHLKSRLSKTSDENEQLRLLNKKLMNEIELRQQQSQTPSPKQVRDSLHPLSLQQQQQLQLPHSPASRRSNISPSSSPFAQRFGDESRSLLTIQNIRQLDTVSDYPLSHSSASANIADLHDHVHLLEQKLQQRDYELQTLQIEIEKGTSSIMSSVEDLCIASSTVSPTPHSPLLNPKLLAITTTKNQPTIEQLQNDIDQLHDKLDELTRENQTLKNRTQEFDTIYEENEYLYAEKSHWNEEIERGRIRELVLEQEIYSLKEREKEFLITNDSNMDSSNITQLKLKIDWLHRTNNELELENVRLREQMDLITQKCQEMKKELIHKDDHHKQILSIVEDKQQLPDELIRLEKIKVNMENQMEKERQHHEKTIATLEEQSDKREQKYSALYDTIIKLQNDYRQKELDYVQQMDDVLKQRSELHTQLTTLQNEYKHIQQENKSLKEEIKSKDEISRDFKQALTSSNNDIQTTYNQLRQVNMNLSDLQQKYDRDLAERNKQIDILHNQHKQTIITYDDNLLKTQQTIIQLQHDNKQYYNQNEIYRTTLEKLQAELDEKKYFIEQVQSDLTERSALHVNINNQLSQENKARITKIADLEQALSQEQQRKIDLQRTIQDLQGELLKSRTVTKESLEKNQELERRLYETDKHFEETIRNHLHESTEPTRRELTSLRAELVTKSDQVTILQYAIDEEKLKRQRLEMKLKRLKEEYISVRKELYNRIEENNSLQHELVECRFKNDFNIHMTNQTFSSIKSTNENEPSTAVQLYLKEKTDSQQWQLKCRTYQHKIEQLQKNYEYTKERYKERLHEEREIFERTKHRYLDHLKNVQRDLHETRQLLEKDTELKLNQESAYQQLIDERRQLLTSMVDKDAKVREMRRENLLLTSKIQLLEDQMENLNERVDRTLRERNQFRREINSVRLDSNLSIETGSRSPSSPSPTRATIAFVDSSSRNQPVHYTESFGFNNGHPTETTSAS
ncbi:unnamed protein product [Adineta steineri]|uniref:Uncharacterized protein n=2 Tax=Adineta steineri TaxID=433720 RepID=A0A819IP76_9BILA|nr:unnamed protein product [Adineta steineri]CAF3922109.1 unnamed protein product [Adineta steineri]